jgi:hypothetical protein
MDWMHLAQGGDQWRGLLITEMNVEVLQKFGNLHNWRLLMKGSFP